MGSIRWLIIAAAAMGFVFGPQAVRAAGPTDLAMVWEAHGAAPIPMTEEKEDSPPAPESEPDISKDLEQDLQALIQELKKLGKDANEKIQKEVLPRIREEIRKLREQLRDWQLKNGESEPPETRSI